MNLAWGALSWGLLIIAALTGWGALFARGLLPGIRGGWGIAAALGIAVTTVLAGVANLARVVSAAGIVGFVVAGAGVAAVLAYRDRAALHAALARGWRRVRDDWLLALVLAALACLLAVRYASAPVRSAYISDPIFQGRAFNMHDDMHSYLVLPEKLLQTGHLGADPFNARQMEASLGASPALTTLVRAVLPRETLHLFEDGVCLIIFFAALATLLVALAVPPRVNALLLLLAQWLLTSNLNLSSHLSSAALVAALCWLLVAPGVGNRFSARWAVALGLVLAGLGALKSTNLPLVGLLAGSLMLAWLVVHRERRVVFAGAVAMLVGVGALLPWMVEMYRNYGTPLFPLLGRGIHYTATATLPAASDDNVWPSFFRENYVRLVAPGAAAVLLALLVAWPAARRRLPAMTWVLTGSVLLAWLGGAAGLSYAGGGIGVTRYVQPLVLVGVPVLFAAWWSFANTFVSGRWCRRRAVGAWLVLFTGWLIVHHRMAWLDLVQAVRFDLNSATARAPMSGDALETQAALLQKAVPAEEKLLVRITHPFLLNFRRNPVYAADWPGAVSPTPGMPLFSGSESLARYLLGQGIRYVAYSYEEEANFAFRHYGWMADPRNARWNRNVALMAFAFQENVTELGVTRRRIYDDGRIFVLDLATYSGRLPPLRVR